MPVNAGGLLSAGNFGAKIILTTTANVVGPATMQEARNSKNWTFQGQGPYSATVTVQGTIDAATAGGTASNWFNIGDLSNPAQPVTFDKPLVAVRAVVSAYVSGTVTILCLAVIP